ncbi:hypothetical protein SK128_022313, partial [Halocaridina rubra]
MSVPSDDLDLHPVREIKPRVLNDIQEVPLVETPRVNLHYVDVSFPKAPFGKSNAASIDSVVSHKKKHSNMENRNFTDFRSEQSPRNATNRADSEEVRGKWMDGRRQFVSQLLHRGGIPVWEEVPQHELGSRVKGFLGPYTPQTNHVANITVRESRRKIQNNKVPFAVWEDVAVGSNVAHSRYEVERVASENQSIANTTHPRQQQEPGQEQAMSDSQSQQSSTSNELPGETKTALSIKSSNLRMQQGAASSYSEPEESQVVGTNNPVLREADIHIHQSVEQDKPLRIMKKKFGGRLADSNDVIGTRSWRIGEMAVKEKFGVVREEVDRKNNRKEDGEEEKHENEPTKEAPKKRDLSASSKISEQPSKKQQKLPASEETPNEASATPPRVRTYEVEEVRKYMEKKRLARTKIYKEQKLQKEQDVLKREQRMKELALKTKEVAQIAKMDKNATSPSHEIPSQIRNNLISKPSRTPNWGCPDDCQHEIGPMHNVPDLDEDTKRAKSRCSDDITKKLRSGKTHSEGSEIKLEMIDKQSDTSSQRDVKDGRGKSEKSDKHRNKDKKKNRKKSLAESSSSESISKLVSRTVEECERQFKSSSIPLSSITSQASVDLSDSEKRSNISHSESSGVDFPPNQRIVSLGQMAQNLTSRITEEEENLKQFLLTNKGVRKKVTKESPYPGKGGNEESEKENRSDTKHLARNPLTYSEIEMLSVEELKTKMTAMLMSDSFNIQGRSDEMLKREISQKAGHSTFEQNMNKYRNITTRRPLIMHEEYPKLKAPSTPELHFFADGRVLFDTNTPSRGNSDGRVPFEFHTPSMGKEFESTSASQNKIHRPNYERNREELHHLPGNNVCVFQNTTPQPLKYGISVEKKTLVDQQGKTCTFNVSERSKFEKAALCIQAAYRGYRVRKITNSLLRMGRIPTKVSSQETDVEQNNVQLSGPRELKLISVNIEDFLLEDTHSVLNPDQRKEISLRKIRRELGASTDKPKSRNAYTFQRSDMPEWVKPYVILSETGNVDNFLDSQMKKTSLANIHTKQTDEKNEKSNHPLMRSQNETANVSNHDCDSGKIKDVSDSVLEDTLTEGLIGDSDEEVSVSAYEKSTQTVLKKHRRLQHKEHEVQVINARKSTNGTENCDIKLQGSKYSLNRDGAQFESINFDKGKESVLLLSEVSAHDDSLEEGPLESESPDNKWKQSLKNSDDISLSSSQIESTHSDWRDVAPHLLLGEGPHFAPANLRLRVNAELTYQDTVNEALSQLQGVEQFHSLARLKDNNAGITRSLLLQQQKQSDAFYRLRDEGMKQEDKKFKEYQEHKKKEIEIQQEALIAVERIEKEAKERLDQLERDIRARAEQIMSFSTRSVEHNSQPDVIATAAVAAVGATISHWERLQAVQVPRPSSLLSQSESLQSQNPQVSSVTHTEQYTTSFTDSVNRTLTRVSHSKRSITSSNEMTEKTEEYSSLSEEISIKGRDKSSSAVENILCDKHSSSSSVRESVHSGGESATSSVSEVLGITKSQKTNSDSDVQEELTNEKTLSHKLNSRSTKSSATSDERIGSASDIIIRKSRSKEKLHASHGKKSKVTSSISDIATQAENLDTRKGSSIVSEDIVPSENYEPANNNSEVSDHVISEYNDNLKSTTNTSECVIPSELIANTNISTKVSEDVVTSEIIESENNTKSVSGTSNVRTSVSSARTSDARTSVASSSRNTRSLEIIRNLPSIQEMMSGSKTTTAITAGSGTHTSTKDKESAGTVRSYSESFETSSTSDESSASVINSSKRDEKEYKGDMTLVVSSNIMAVDQLGCGSVSPVGREFSSGVMEGGGSSALGMTLNLVESLQKEEEIRLQHQTALLKLQEQSLIEEARWKLAALQSEGGSGLRRRQRAVLLQLREQRSHLRRLIETQNLTAQQRRLFLLQHHHLLATTSSMTTAGSKGYPSSSRGHSPNPSSPRLTPRVMEINISSSSEGQEDLSLHLAVRSKDNGTSSMSDSSGREKRRSHSNERKRISSKLQEKRRVMESDPLQKEKELIKSKRKSEISSKRVRDKREKSPVATARLKENSVSTESSVPEESLDVSTHESQSSVLDGGSESVSQSDVASSVSEHEVSQSERKQNDYSLPEEIVNVSKSSTVEEILTKSPSKDSSSLRSITSKSQNSCSKSEIVKESNSKALSGTGSNNTGKSLSEGTRSQELENTGSIHTYISEANQQITDKSPKTQSDINSTVSMSSEMQSTIPTGTVISDRYSGSRSEKITPEETSGTSVSRAAPSRTASQSSSEGEGRASDTVVNEVKLANQRVYSRALPLPLRIPLSPRSPHRQQRRYSSESDDSFTLSQTETASDASDGEGRLIALKEQLASRRAEADKLKREKRRLRRERLSSQEQALRQQIANYDAYIQQAKLELEKESKELQQVSQVRPLIKKPQVAESKKIKQNEMLISSPDKSDASDISAVSEGKSDHSSSSKLQEPNIDHSLSNRLKSLKSEHSLPSKTHEIDFKAPSQHSQKAQDAPCTSAIIEDKLEIVTKSDTTLYALSNEVEVSKETNSYVSEEYSFEEESSSEWSGVNSEKSPLSRDSSQDTDQTPSQASSTETIVHSPKKLNSGQKEGEGSSSVEVDDMPEASVGMTADLIAENCGGNIISPNIPNRNEDVEKKLEIFIPTLHPKAEADESTDKGKDTTPGDKEATSAEESIDEEIVDNVQQNSLNDVSDILNKNILATDITEDTKLDDSLEKSEEMSCALSKLDSVGDGSECLDSIQNTENQVLKELDEIMTPSKPSDRQKEVDDISNSILVSLMKETSLLFRNILKGKEDKDSDQSAVAFQKALSKQEMSLKIPSEKDKDSLSKDDFREVSVDTITLTNKSHLLKRVNDMIAESESSPRTAALTSPRGQIRQLTPQLTFDISPDSGSPTDDKDLFKGESEKGSDTPAFTDGSKSICDGNAASQGASPSHDINKAEDYCLDTEIEGDNFAIDPTALTNKLLNLTPADLDLESKFDQIEDGNLEFSVEGIEGNWFDDDFWTSGDSKKRQQQLKAEEERIAAEIAHLEELQRLQEQFPGLVIREVPNKPPPPYTPPASSSPSLSPTSTMPPAYRITAPPDSAVTSELQVSTSNTISIPHRLSKADLRKLATEIFHVVPSAEDEAIPIITESLDCLYEALEKGLDPNTVEPPSKFIASSSASNHSEDSSEEEEESCSRIFHHLLFSLVRELVGEVYNLQRAPPHPPWVKQPFPPKQVLVVVHATSQKVLYAHVQDRIKGLFGWNPPAEKESLMIRWARKHRDLVDQVLVKELQAEEASWTCYDEDEASVK